MRLAGHPFADPDGSRWTPEPRRKPAAGCLRDSETWRAASKRSSQARRSCRMTRSRRWRAYGCEKSCSFAITVWAVRHLSGATEQRTGSITSHRTSFRALSSQIHPSKYRRQFQGRRNEAASSAGFVLVKCIMHVTCAMLGIRQIQNVDHGLPPLPLLRESGRGRVLGIQTGGDGHPSSIKHCCKAKARRRFFFSYDAGIPCSRCFGTTIAPVPLLV